MSYNCYVKINNHVIMKICTVMCSCRRKCACVCLCMYDSEYATPVGLETCFLVITEITDNSGSRVHFDCRRSIRHEPPRSLAAGPTTVPFYRNECDKTATPARANNVFDDTV